MWKTLTPFAKGISKMQKQGVNIIYNVTVMYADTVCYTTCDGYSLNTTLYSVDPASCGPESIILSMAFFSAGEQICNNTQR